MNKIVITILKKILPQSLKNKLKISLSKYPYLFHPSFLLNKKKNIAELEKIVSKKKYKGIVIFPPTIDWHMPLFQRPQQMAQAFAREGYLFFYCTSNLRFDRVNGFEKIEENLFLTNQMHLLKSIKDPILFISWPFNAFYIDKFNNPKVIYDYIDELEVFDTSGKTLDELKKDHQYLVQKSDVVVATADILLADVKKLNPKKAVLAPNAVDFNHFKITNSETPKDMKAIVGSNNPVIGYYGAIAEWFDYKLLEEIAIKRPEYNFVIIGPFDYDKTLQKNSHLFDVPNIYFLGPKKYEELPGYLNHFNVAVIPFIVNKITKSTSPVKLFEYMAGGKPIVTTAMDECKKYQSVLIAKNGDDFVSKLDQAIKLSKDKDYLKTLEKEATENTWRARVRQIINEL